MAYRPANNRVSDEVFTFEFTFVTHVFRLLVEGTELFERCSLYPVDLLLGYLGLCSFLEYGSLCELGAALRLPISRWLEEVCEGA